jgi:LPXTG-site transpeptidase (sortase) family protein
MANLPSRFSYSLSIVLAITLILTATSIQSVYAATGPLCYVRVGASGAGDSWGDAYPDLQSALADNNCTEIWVAQGTYYPDEGTGQTNDDRSSTFTLKNNVAIYGGFDGAETLRTDRDWEDNTTTLSGDIDQTAGDSGNAYHVLVGSNTDSTAILDGFTITAGNADAPIPTYPTPTDPNSNGGGLYSFNGNATLKNLIFYSNKAIQGGGGIHARADYGVTGYSPTLDNVIFNMNTSGISGAGIYLGFVSTPGSIKNTTFKNNTTAYEGGGMMILACNPTLENVTFSKNTAAGGPEVSYLDYRGAAIFNDLGSKPSITNATFSGNSADSKGGAIYNANNSEPTITNATFTDNSATTAGGAIYNFASYPTLNNVILWGNTAPAESELFDEQFPSYPPYNAESTIKDSVIQGGCPANSNCTNIITTDPKLDALSDNGGNTQTHALLPGSSAIDKGASCPATDQRGISRPQGAGCDIGAYESGGFNVSSTSPTSGATLISLDTIEVTFSEDALHDSSNKAADHTDNYILVEAGVNGSFNTLSCAGGVISDDVDQNIINAAYANNGGAGPFTATLTLENSLEDGDYRLFICGTTSIWSTAGMELNDGLVDNTVSFTVGLSPSSLPETGFRHGEVTQLPKQPAAKAYTETAMLLEIPKLRVSMPIVGVPQSENGWDVTWLGNSAGYLYGSAFPTWAGNTVITGHVWDAYNQPGIFSELKTLSYGDQIQIQAWGQTYTYEVRESKLVTKKNTNVAFQSEQYDWLTLVTCEFYNPFSGDYLFRRAVRAVLVSVK